MDEDETVRTHWRRFEFAGVTAIITTVAFLLIGQSVEQIASQVTSPPMESAQLKPKFNAIDYASTGALKGATVVIGPCQMR